MSTLREMVEREMRANFITLDDSVEVMAVDAAVDVAIRLLGKWGHASNCRCHAVQGMRACTELGSHYIHPFIDPRCAQPGGEEGKRG